MRGSKRKHGTEESQAMRSYISYLSHISSTFIVSNHDKLVGGLPPPVSTVSSGDVEVSAYTSQRL